MCWRPARSIIFGLVLLVVGMPGALAQARLDIFVTPVPNAPFSGAVSVERSFVLPDGSVAAFRTIRGIGRDRQGRIFNEARALVPAASNIAPALTGIHLYDPQTRISTLLDPRRRTFRTMTVMQPPATEPPALLYGSPTGNSLPQNSFAREEDLGTRQMQNLPVHGVRETQVIPADKSSTGKEIVITDEYWYSDDLHMNLAIRHNDPRTASVSMGVTQLTLAEPDPALFQIPDGYTAEVPGAPAPR